MKLLYVEDNQELAQSVKTKLQPHYIIHTSRTGQQARTFVNKHDYDLIILDYYLPDATGLEICQYIRNNHIKTPVLFLSQNDAKPHIANSLDYGADDYLTKPFDFQELQARIRALIRRSNAVDQCSSTIKVGQLILNQVQQQVKYQDQVIPLKRQEYLLLEYLMLHKGHTVSRSRLIEHVWGKDYYQSNTIDVHIRKVRQKIDLRFNHPMIISVYGLGYKIEDGSD
jgi:DNA-binding response OmpR family regulator